MIEKWAYYFKHAEETSEEDIHKIFEKDVIIQRAYEELDRFHWKEEELRAYEAVVKHEMDYQASLDFKFDQGIQQGEKKMQLHIAKNMLKQGLSIQNISSATGFSAREVKKIQEETKK